MDIIQRIKYLVFVIIWTVSEIVDSTFVGVVNDHKLF